MKRLIVARYKEGLEWLDDVSKEFHITVIQKQTEELEGDMPNAGREPASYFFAIVKFYDTIKPDDVWAFVQGNPHDHCMDVPVIINRPIEGFTWLGNPWRYSDHDGNPTHPNLPVAEKYEEWLGREFPGRVDFAPGCQFMVLGSDLLKYPKEWYIRVMDDFTPAYNAWVAERIWSEIFK
jgi:hypothetical protein